MKLIMLIKLRIFYIIKSFNKIKMKLRFYIMLNKSFIAKYYVKRNELFKKNDENWNFLTIYDDY
jgi:hypothetical protein